MDQADTLLTIAELGVALAGFASIVTVIGRRQSVVVGAPLRVMLEVALRNAAFALLPLPFLQSLPSDPIVWRVGSGLYLIAVGLHYLFRVRRANTVSERWLNVSGQILVALTAVAGVANVLGLAGSDAFSLYLANLLLGLGASGLYFLSVIATVFRTGNE